MNKYSEQKKNANDFAKLKVLEERCKILSSEDREIIGLEKLCNAACNIKFFYYPRLFDTFRKILKYSFSSLLKNLSLEQILVLNVTGKCQFQK